MKSVVRHVEFLDPLRGVAILAVLLFHTLSTVYGYDVLPWKGWFRDFSVSDSFLYFLPLSVGNAGVPIFFVISGFCIHMSFQSQGQSWGSFFIRRVFRIYPAYIAALAFFSLLYMAHYRLGFSSQEVWTQLLMHLFLVHNFLNSTIGEINGSFWSLAVEAQLYLLYPALLFLVAKLGWRRTMFILAGIELSIRGAHGVVEALGVGNTTAGNIFWKFTISPLGYWFSWSLGAHIADAFLKSQPLPFARTSSLWWLGLAVISYFVKPLDAFQFLFFALATAAIASRRLKQIRPENKSSFISWRMLGKIGLWSYSIYLLHQPLFNAYYYTITWAFPMEHRSGPMGFLLVLATWLVVIPFGVLWYKIFELPGIALGKRIIRKTLAQDGTKAGLESPRVSAPASKMTTGYYPAIYALVMFVIASYWVGAKLIPPDPGADNNLAWALATSPDIAKRNGTLAIQLAENACQRTQYQRTVYLGTLAAAYAEGGRFDDAIAAAQQACDQAAKNGETNLLQRNQELLALYRNHQAYHEQ